MLVPLAKPPCAFLTLVMCIFSFSWSVFPGASNLLTFLRTNFWPYWFFCCSVFPFLSVIFSSNSDLICHSFSNFSRCKTLSNISIYSYLVFIFCNLYFHSSFKILFNFPCIFFKPKGYLEVCYLISKYLKSFYISFVTDFWFTSVWLEIYGFNCFKLIVSYFVVSIWSFWVNMPWAPKRVCCSSGMLHKGH